MRKMGTSLYITSPDIYLALDSGNVVAKREDAVIARYPLHILEHIVSFSYLGASPALMGYCGENHIGFVICKPSGKFLFRVSGMSHGNVLVRQEQYRIADDESRYFNVAKNMIVGKVYNSRWVIERLKRDHAMRVDVDALSGAIEKLKSFLNDIQSITNSDSLRGLEGVAANAYFSVFQDMILGDKDLFYFDTRNRRPPLDPVNALLSFVYTILANECASALESVGLDPYVGFMHRSRPGRKSLALDLMEELRPCVADKFVLSLINNRRLSCSDFLFMDSGAVLLNDSGKKVFFKAWQEKKKTEITHPYLKEKMPWGLVPFVQAQLLSRHIRGDIDGYPPFFWR